MRVYHDSRDPNCRKPYGAVIAGGAVSLSIEIWDAQIARCTCRLWIDGEGETLVPMTREESAERARFSCDIKLNEPSITWYSFIIELSDGSVKRYGAAQGRTGGEGQLYDYEPPSFQITVYKERKAPRWYKDGIVYLVFPDRFRRGEGWRQLAQKAVPGIHKNGPARVVEEDWYKPPMYKRNEKGEVISWDFYGGTLSGIREKLGYLKELGVTVLYLNPIFEAASNHRYDTGNYMQVDPLLGGDDAFKELAAEARRMGISIILDGVFNHSGSDSLYFNIYGNYPTLGASQSKDSPYRDWYRFDNSPTGYECWWGVADMPNFEESNSDFRKLIFEGEDSVVRTWLRAGARGWRLDVADELPDSFIAGIKSAVIDELGDDGLLLGEVWEDASNKVSYGSLRRYLLGDELDSVMNYPLRKSLYDFLLGKSSSSEVRETLESLKENYPREAFYSALNLMGSHDRLRIMTAMGGAPDESTMSEQERGEYRLTDGMRGLAKGRIWLATLIQMTMPGVPCIYYGDEAGMEGYSDPFNRAGYPWGRQDVDLLNIYRNAISIRKLSPLFVDGDFSTVDCGSEDVFCFLRRLDGESAAVLINRSLSETRTVRFPADGKEAAEIVGGHPFSIEEGEVIISLYPMGSAVIYFGRHEKFGAAMPSGSGVLCHITSLPNAGAAGNIGAPARKFIDFLAESGQKYWQILPVNPTDEHGSPYAGASAFAANVSLLPESQEQLRREFMDFVPDEGYRQFCRDNSFWLYPYAAFTALRQLFDEDPWNQWPEKYRTYRESLLEDPEIAREAKFLMFCQYRFEQEWQSLREYAHKKGISIVGDLPMYVSQESADVWSEPEYFTLDKDGRKEMCAGVPPDYFSSEGQHWGNPLYNWQAIEDSGWDWWLRRLARSFALYDYVRLDHFRGFESYWAIPEGKPTKEGRWLYGPGSRFFKAAYDKFGPLPVLAEDLGSLTPAVRGLVALCGFNGTDVAQFYDGDPMQNYVPPKGKIAYTGTHDNETLLGWCQSRYPGMDALECARKIIFNVMASRAEIVILPIQDVLELDNSARMNTPGTTERNWCWQASENEFEGAAKRLRKLTEETGRTPGTQNKTGK